MEETLVSIVNTLRAKGYTEDFYKSGMFCGNPEDFEIDKVYRFDGMTDMEDESVTYAISSKDGKRKGVLINAYGIYSDENINKIVEKMSVKADSSLPLI